MPSQRLIAAYREVRRHCGGYTPGRNAIRAWDQAKTLVKWRAAERAGYVRLDVEDDQDFWPSPDNCECDDPECSAKTGPAYGTVGRVLKAGSEPGSDRERDWEHADSVWGHTGYRDPGDWRENPYVLDIMAETLDALKESRNHHPLSPETLLSCVGS